MTQPRCLLGDARWFHATGRAVAGEVLWRDDEDRLAFVRRLERVTVRHCWRCVAYCLMSNHYHLVLETPLEALSNGMRELNGGHALRFNTRHGRHGHLFEGRFRSWVLRDEPHFARTAEYVVQNPVRAGLVVAAADWRWSDMRLDEHVFAR